MQLSFTSTFELIFTASQKDLSKESDKSKFIHRGGLPLAAFD